MSSSRSSPRWAGSFSVTTRRSSPARYESLRVYFIDPRHLTDANSANSLLGFIVSSALFGCIHRRLPRGRGELAVGPQAGTHLAAVLFVISALGSAAPEFLMAPIGHGGPGYIGFFVFYRVLGGIGVGLASMLSPMYIAEIAPARLRGNLVAWNQFAIVSGMIIVYFVNYTISLDGAGDAWLNEVGCATCSPPARSRPRCFCSSCSSSGDAALPHVEGARGRGARGPGAARHAGRKTRWRSRKSVPRCRSMNRAGSFRSGLTVLVIGVLLSVLSAIRRHQRRALLRAGDFPQHGMGTNASLLQTIIVGAVNWAFTVIAILCVDNYGRKPLQIIGALAMAGSMFGLGLALTMQEKGSLALVCMLAYIAGFAVSWDR